MNEIRAKVVEQLATANTAVKDKVIDHLYQEELAKRTAATLKVVSRLEETEKEYRKLEKPDVETFGADGVVANASYSKERNEARKKNREEAAKLEAALKAALEENKFDKVLELGK